MPINWTRINMVVHSFRCFWHVDKKVKLLPPARKEHGDNYRNVLLMGSMQVLNEQKVVTYGMDRAS